MAQDDEQLRKTIANTIKSMSGMDSAAKKSEGAIDTLSNKFVDVASGPLTLFSQFVGQNTKVFEDLSNVGSSFGNSLNGMKIAAAESRLSLDEFAEVLAKNNKNFIGLGSNAAEGGKAFAKFSKDFFDSGLGDKLTQMGYTTKDLNDVLALQLTISRSSAQDTEEGRRRSIQSAADLAEQMDALAKLTGKSRKEQMEAMAAQQADMQLEAALRRDTRNMSAAEAEEYKTKVRQAIEYERTTRGEAAALAAKEQFATGTLMSDTSRKYAAVSGEAFQSQAKSIEALKKRDYEAAEAHKKRTDAETVALQDNQAYQDLVIYNSKAAGVVGETMKASQTMYEGVKNTLGGLKNNAENASIALEKNREKIKEEQQAREGHTSLMIAANNRMKDAEAAATRVARQELLPGGKLDKQLVGVAEKYQQGVKPGMSNKEIVDLYGQAKGKEGPASSRELYLERMDKAAGEFVKGTGNLVGKFVETADKGLSQAGKFIDAFNTAMGKSPDVIKSTNEALTSLYENITSKKEGEPKKTGRAGGTLGETGQILEPKDVMALLHKGEMVLTPEQQKSFLTNARTSAFTDMLTMINQNVSGSGGGKLPGIDLQKVAKDIATTTSKVEVTNWPKSMPVQVAGAQSPQPAAKQAAPANTEEKKPVKVEVKEEKKPAKVEVKEEKKPVTTVKEEKPKDISTRTNLTEIKNDQTKLTVNGRDVDPNSKEGQAAMKQLDETAKKTEQAIAQISESMAGGNAATVKLDPKDIEDMAKSSGIHMTEAQKQVAATAPTAKASGPSMTKKSSAEFLLDNQITQASSDMRGSSAVDKGALNDALSLSEKEREEKKKKYQEEYDLAQKEVSDRDKRLIEIEKRYEDEGRAADAKNDEEYMRLEAQEKIFLQQRGNAQKNLQALKEVDDIKRKVEDQGYDFEKVNANRLQNLTKESAEAVQKEMKEAIPVKDLQGSLAKASESLDEHGKKTLQFVMNDSDELLEVRKRNAKNGIKGEEAEIAERQARIKELENKSFESELTRREKNYIEFQKGEIASAEERKKLRESDLRAIELVEKSRQGILEESNKVTKQAFDTMADDVAEISKVLPDTMSKSQEELEVIADDMRAGITDALPTSEITKAFSDLTMAADEMGAELAESIPTSQITKSLSDMTMEADEIGAELAESIPTSQITKSLSDMTMEADEVGAELAESIPTSQITKSLSDMTMEADEIGAELAESMPTSQITKSLSDMTMEADEIGAELAESIPTSQITRSLSDMTMEADEIGAELEKSLPTSQITKSLSDMMMEADEIAAEMPSNFESKFTPVQVEGLDELEKGDSEQSVNKAIEAQSKARKMENFSAPSLGQIGMDSRGMPIISKKAQESIPGAVKKDEVAKTAADKESAKKEDTKKDTDKKDVAKEGAKTSNKTLDDVYKILSDLNTNIVKLTGKVEETSKNQVNAVKASLSGNQFNR